MAQVTMYMPEDLATALRQEASRKGLSLSAYVVERLKGGTAPSDPSWMERFIETRCGFLQGDFDIPEPPPLGPVELS